MNFAHTQEGIVMVKHQFKYFWLQDILFKRKDVICLWINLTVSMSLKAHYKLSVKL